MLLMLISCHEYFAITNDMFYKSGDYILMYNLKKNYKQNQHKGSIFFFI